MAMGDFSSPAASAAGSRVRLAAVVASAALPAVLAMALLAGCSAAPSTETEHHNATDGSTPAASQAGDAASADAEDAVETEALVVAARDGQVLLVDRQTETPFFPTGDAVSIVNSEGNEITSASLKPGNVVKVVGDGIMLESYPGQYPGVTKIEVVDLGSPSDAEEYETLVSAVFPESDSMQPTGSVQYKDSLGNVSMTLEPYASEWVGEAAADGDAASPDGTFYEEDGTVTSSVVDARIEEPLEATVTYDEPAKRIQVQRIALANSEPGSYAVDTDAQPQDVSAEEGEDGAATFTIEPGYAYTVHAVFGLGEESSAFVVAER
ncbi:hypothetical protein GMI70_08175 [Eggerthellaceae bacterium zg-893]|nr:hypothetical protein [Eggerthellaceae bacterium zg-893]